MKHLVFECCEWILLEMIHTKWQPPFYEYGIQDKNGRINYQRQQGIDTQNIWFGSNTEWSVCKVLHYACLALNNCMHACISQSSISYLLRWKKTDEHGFNKLDNTENVYNNTCLRWIRNEKCFSEINTHLLWVYGFFFACMTNEWQEFLRFYNFTDLLFQTELFLWQILIDRVIYTPKFNLWNIKQINVDFVKNDSIQLIWHFLLLHFRLKLNCVTFPHGKRILNTKMIMSQTNKTFRNA